MPKPVSFTKSDAIRQVAGQLKGPILLAEFVDRVLAIWPSAAKDPKGSIRIFPLLV